MTSRALVVDDNRVNRILLGRALEQLGVESVEAGNGLRALQVMAETPVDVVLLDRRARGERRRGRRVRGGLT